MKTPENSTAQPVGCDALFAVLEPVIDWYQSDELPERHPLDIIRDIVADLQSDRKAALAASSAARDALELCHQIERCGCSPELTEASIMASRLREKLDSAHGSAHGSALLRLLTAASLMRIGIKERATFLTRTTDWERLEDAIRNAERELKAPNKADEGGPFRGVRSIGLVRHKRKKL